MAKRAQPHRYVFVVGPQNPITFTSYGYCRKAKLGASDSGDQEEMQSSTATSYVGV